MKTSTSRCSNLPGPSHHRGTATTDSVPFPANAEGSKTPIRATLSVKALMVWVAGLAALTGLVEETLRRVKVEGAAGIVGASLVLYIVYLSLSVRAFWSAPRIVVPTTMLIGGVLWTLSLQALDRVPRPLAIAMVIAVPFATALGVRLIFPKMAGPDDTSEDQGRPLTVRSLLNRHKGLGAPAESVKPTPEPEL